MRKKGLVVGVLMLSLLMQSTWGIKTQASNIDDIKISSDTVVFVGESYLSIRESPTSSSTELGRLNNGASATKTGDKDGSWIKIKSGDVVGWIYEPYTLSGDDLNDYIIDNLNDFNVDVQISKATGQYLSLDSLKNDTLSYSTKVTFPRDGISIYKTESLSDNIKGQYSEKKVVILTTDGVRIREKSDTDSTILDMYDKGKDFSLVLETDDWYKVKYNSELNGYIHKSCAKLENKKFNKSNIANISYTKNMMYDAEILDRGIVRVKISGKDYYTSIDDVYLFYRPDETSSAVVVASEKEKYDLKRIDKRNKVYVIEEVSDSTGASVDLFMKAGNSDLIVKFDKATSVESSNTDDSGVNFIPKSTKSKYKDMYNYEFDSTSTTEERGKIINYALSYLGNPYIYGGTSLTNGIDCSAFVQKVLQKHGIDISRTTSTQVGESRGKVINAKDIQPGDLIYYTKDGRTPYHVVMYLGGDKVVHASCEKYGICIGTVKTDKILMIKNYID